MALQIVWTKRAKANFGSIVGYLEANWSEQVTTGFAKRVYSFLEILAEFPEIGSIQDQQRGIRGFLVEKQTKIFYRIEGKKLYLLNFFDTRQDPKQEKY